MTLGFASQLKGEGSHQLHSLATIRVFGHDFVSNFAFWHTMIVMPAMGFYVLSVLFYGGIKENESSATKLPFFGWGYQGFKNKILTQSVGVLTIIGIVIFSVVFVSRANKPSYLNIKSIPENTSNYLLIHNDLIAEGFSSYFLKYPLELTKFYKFFKKFKLINSSVDYGIILNEPTTIYLDNNTKSLNGIVKVKDSDYSIGKVNGNLIKEGFKEIVSNKTYSTFVFNNKKYNQLYIIFKYGEVNKDSLYFQLKEISLNADTTNANKEIVEYYQENKKSILYQFQNLEILNSVGTSNLKGSIDLKSNKIDFLGTGNIDENFIFKNDDQLNSTNYGWAEFSGNFNPNQIPKTILKQITRDENLDMKTIQFSEH